MMPQRRIPTLIVAGARSGVGKTTVTIGLIASLKRLGLVVQPFKVGPDYVDPTYHERAAHRPCRNLDAWMLSDSQLLEGFSRACSGADIAVVEGVMGLFDGCSWTDERGSTAQIAKLLGAPVVLVLDIGGTARSAAITVLGCRHFDPVLALRAVALNFAGSESHAAGCAEAIRERTGLPVIGWLPRHSALRVPERHLGLVPSGESAGCDALIADIATEVEQRFQIAAIAGLAGVTDQRSHSPAPKVAAEARAGSRPVIAVARDQAFCFYYPENLELLEEAGAAVEFFSPLAGEQPCRQAGGVYLGGGYPELYGAALAANVGLWDALQALNARNAPIYAECGGFMVLTRELVDCEGRRWPMAGLLPGIARMSTKLATLGYRSAIALRANLLADAGDSVRGHEFRYSSWICEVPVAPETAAWQLHSTLPSSDGGTGGYTRGNLLASYLHVHFGQREEIARRIVQRLQRR